MNRAEQTLMAIKNALNLGETQIENGELLASDVLESVSGIVDDYFKET